MIATPWMTWFSLPSFCASCNWIHFIASLQCHCAEHYSHGAELVTVFPRLSLRRGSGLGSHGGEASGLLEVHWEWLVSWGSMGMGALQQHGNRPKRASAGRVLNCSLLPSLKLCRTVSPTSEGLVEVLCRGEFSTPHDIKFFVLSGAVLHSRTIKVLCALGAAEVGGWGFDLL